MQTRRLGRTEHQSSVAILGCCALGWVGEQQAGELAAHALAAGVNHLDVAPSYGEAELRLGAHLPTFRDRVFLACKSMERTRDGMLREAEASLQRLGTDRFDLYQLHAVTTDADVDAILAPGGAGEALAELQRRGLTRHAGATGHFEDVPRLMLRLLEQLDLDTVMLPIGVGHWAMPSYRSAAERLLEECSRRDVGVMAIKALARRHWPTEDHAYQTWYEPADVPEEAQRAVDFTLSQPVTGFCTPCEPKLLGVALAAAERFQPMATAQREALVASGWATALTRAR
jgi:aryl-alcohol dehydrogenase-like predicted oxidoreductase